MCSCCFSFVYYAENSLNTNKVFWAEEDAVAHFTHILYSSPPFAQNRAGLAPPVVDSLRTMVGYVCDMPEKPTPVGDPVFQLA